MTRSVASERLHRGPVVVAVDDNPDNNSPVLCAAELARRHGARVHALHVLDISHVPRRVPLAGALALGRELIGEAPYAEDERAWRGRLEPLVGEQSEWRIHIAAGIPATEILRVTREVDAALVVMGLRRHGILDRLQRDETTLNVARRATAPVLGLVPGLQGLPRRAVVGVDFGPASVRAAKTALGILAGSATAPASLLLAYADSTPDYESREDTAGEAVIRKLGVAAAFESLQKELDVPATLRIESVALRGSPAQEILKLSEQAGADLIAVGSMRHERVERLLLGSVTTEIVRDGRCSVLVLPPAEKLT